MLVKTPFKITARIDTRGNMTLVVDQIPQRRLFAVGIRCTEKMVKTHIVQSRTGGKTGNMTTQIAGTLFVRTQHHGQRVPTHQRADTALHKEITRHRRFFFGRNRISVWRVQRVWQRHPVSGGALGNTLNKEVGSFESFCADYRVDCVHPLFGFLGICIVGVDLIIHQLGS